MKVSHDKLASNALYYVQQRQFGQVGGDVFLNSDSTGMIAEAVIENLTKKEMVFQKGQCLATLTKMEDIYVNKRFPDYACFISIGLNFDKLFAHLPANIRKAWIELMSKWHTVLSKNKYDVGLIQEEYTIRLSDPTPIKSYIPRQTLAMITAINEELGKLRQVNFIEPLKNPYAALIVCVQKPDGSMRIIIDFRIVNKNIINNAYPMYRLDNQLDALQGAQVFTSINLIKGYHQMNLD